MSSVGAAWTRISVVHLGGVGLAFVALIAGCVGFIACFIRRGHIWDIVVQLVRGRCIRGRRIGFGSWGY